MILHATLHRTYDVALVVSVQKSEYFDRLVFAVALFTLKSFQIRHADFSQLGKTLPQPLHLFFVVARRCMGGIGATLSRESLQQHVPSDFRKRAVVDQEMFFADSHRQRLANQSPGNRVTIARILDCAVGIDDPVDDLCGIECQ